MALETVRIYFLISKLIRQCINHGACDRFSVFGDLFEEAARQGLPAVQARHPGFYYEQAAQYATQRKKLTNDLCKVRTKKCEKIMVFDVDETIHVLGTSSVS